MQSSLINPDICVNLNGNTVGGQRSQANTLGLVISNAGVANNYFPGNSDCTTSLGSQVR
jgi:hypothetical protein